MKRMSVTLQVCVLAAAGVHAAPTSPSVYMENGITLKPPVVAKQGKHVALYIRRGACPLQIRCREEPQPRTPEVLRHRSRVECRPEFTPVPSSNATSELFDNYWYKVTIPSSGTDFSRFVLHEFGRALGLVQAHQSPNAQLSWITDRVCGGWQAWFGWDKPKVERKMDQLSVMNCQIPEAWTEEGLVIPRRYILSPTDRAEIVRIYSG
jgi:hypothetical protein